MFYREACVARDNSLSQPLVRGNQTDQPVITCTTKDIDHKVYWLNLYCCPSFSRHKDYYYSPLFSHWCQPGSLQCNSRNNCNSTLFSPSSSLKLAQPARRLLDEPHVISINNWQRQVTSLVPLLPTVPITAFSLPPPLFFHLFFFLKAS